MHRSAPGSARRSIPILLRVLLFMRFRVVPGPRYRRPQTRRGAALYLGARQPSARGVIDRGTVNWKNRAGADK